MTKNSKKLNITEITLNQVKPMQLFNGHLKTISLYGFFYYGIIRMYIYVYLVFQNRRISRTNTMPTKELSKWITLKITQVRCPKDTRAKK